MSSGPDEIRPQEATTVRIKDHDKVLELKYHGAISQHRGSLWWGTAVGFRAMQVAAEALSGDDLWSRDDLYVVGAHAGHGIRDAINYVSGAVDRDRYNVVVDEGCEMRCNSSMKFEWWVSDGQKTAAIRLRKDFVPAAFYELADRLGSPQETEEDLRQFDIFKVTMASQLWNEPLETNFTVEVIDEPLEPGKLPEPVEAKTYWDDMEDIRTHRS